ncbi:MAG: hypothetical protein ACREOO_12265 [bacterium]
MPEPENLPRLLLKSDPLAWWIEQYLSLEVTTVENSRRGQRQDLQAFLSFMRRKIWDAADMLPKVGGLSRDRYRHKSPGNCAMPQCDKLSTPTFEYTFTKLLGL